MARAALQDSTGSETICSISAKFTYFLQKQMLRQRLENKSCLAEGEDAGAGGTKKESRGLGEHRLPGVYPESQLTAAKRREQPESL